MRQKVLQNAIQSSRKCFVQAALSRREAMREAQEIVLSVGRPETSVCVMMLAVWQGWFQWILSEFQNDRKLVMTLEEGQGRVCPSHTDSMVQSAAQLA